MVLFIFIYATFLLQDKNTQIESKHWKKLLNFLELTFFKLLKNILKIQILRGYLFHYSN